MVGTMAIGSAPSSTGFEETPSESTPGHGTFRARIVNGGHDPLQAPLPGLRSGRGQHALLAHPLRPAWSGRRSGRVPVRRRQQAGVHADRGHVRGRHRREPTSSARRARGSRPGEMDEVITAMRKGFTYANVHTTLEPGRIDPWTDSQGLRSWGRRGRRPPLGADQPVTRRARSGRALLVSRCLRACR